MAAERRFTSHPGYLAQLRVQLAKSLKQLKSKSLTSPQRLLPPTSNALQNLQDSGLPVVKMTVIHNFNQEIVVETQELKHQLQPQISPPNPSPSPPPDPPAADPPLDKNIEEESPAAPQVEEQLNKETPQYQVYRLGDVYNGRRIVMKHLGLDIGTKTIVVAFKDDDNKIHYISEINGYWPFERATPFVENMLNDPNKIRSDGTKRPARWIKLPDSERIIVLGRDAEEFAYAKNDTLLRPMAEGGISPDEEAMTVLSTIVQGLIQMAEHDIGKFEGEAKICYCTTAPAINRDSNVEYHQRVVNLILDGYETKAKKTFSSIKESHAIVLEMSQDGTGIGISWGAGTVTVSYVKYGMEIYSFCWIGAGDWIDEQVAKRHGYDPELFKTRKKTAKETPTTVARRKMDVDLTPGKEPEDRIGLDVVLHYDVLISQVVEGIVQGFEAHESQARIDEGITVYMAGGTSSPKGFVQRVIKKFDEKSPPFTINEVKRSERPLYAVAEGCLKAAEMF